MENIWGRIWKNYLEPHFKESLGRVHWVFEKDIRPDNFILED